ncbi:GH3 auxin-responsive promoter family protein, partial [Flavobacteriales bacterium]|nr:GH3 auxin-responsive promoter family protein [Flavobacteriales bacterium]
PLIRFVQKGKGVCNITGEKLYEGQVLKAIDTWGVACQHVQAVADVEQARYVVYAELSEDTPYNEEASSRVLDDALKILNMEYRDKRSSGRLHALTCRFMKPGALQAIKAHAVASGQREGQFKTVLLQYRADLDFDFEAWSR